VLYARDVARRGQDVSVLLRAYELGHQHFWAQWTTRFSRRAADPSVLAELYDVSARFLFSYFDAVPAAVTREYQLELQRHVATADARRAEVVRQLLAGAPIDVRGAEAELGHSIAEGDHAAVILESTRPGSPPGEGDARRAVGPAALIVAGDSGRLWVPEEPPLARLPRGLRAGVGDPGEGVDGFRASHREAEIALRHGHGPGVVRYRDVAMASLLGADAARAQRFVRRELGRLAEDGPSVARLRATLRAFLAENSNQARTARRLEVHYNTVTYRLRQAEELLGRPIAERRLELETALLLHASWERR
jgi:DNA-binding PucR family transcriptional regulator